MSDFYIHVTLLWAFVFTLTPLVVVLYDLYIIAPVITQRGENDKTGPGKEKTPKNAGCIKGCLETESSSRTIPSPKNSVTINNILNNSYINSNKTNIYIGRSCENSHYFG
uniref:Uncharacterized protein n=1 Tax=Octopus bimaculoides TaxID=37653 RepID=A0A0L8G4M7_OCTBM